MVRAIVTRALCSLCVLYISSMLIFFNSSPFDTIKGVFNFLNRVYKFFTDPAHIQEIEEDAEVLKSLHYTIKKVENDVEGLRFNTAISQMMIFTNLCIKKGRVSQDTAMQFMLVLSPFAPHLAEEIWELLGQVPTISDQPFPAYNEQLLVEDVYEYPVSFNGKLRFKVELPVDIDEEEIKKIILEHEKAQKWLDGKPPRKFIIVPNKIINVVV